VGTSKRMTTSHEILDPWERSSPTEPGESRLDIPPSSSQQSSGPIEPDPIYPGPIHPSQPISPEVVKDWAKKSDLPLSEQDVPLVQAQLLRLAFCAEQLWEEPSSP
jgi:hypothetical protein